MGRTARLDGEERPLPRLSGLPAPAPLPVVLMPLRPLPGVVGVVGVAALRGDDASSAAER